MLIQLKITLQEVQPPIWRRVLVSDETTLLQLHDLIQHCFGWTDSHLHIFTAAGMAFVNVEDWEEEGEHYQDDGIAHLSDLIPKFLPEGGHFLYEYDLGDGWVFKIFVEKILPEQENIKTPEILAGKRAGPPEDVGGVWGYANFLEAMQDPLHPEHDEYLAWIGGSFDPQAFNISELNQTLSKRMKRSALERASTWPVGPEFVNFRDITQNEWTETLPERQKAAAADLPLRRDIVTLLTYLSQNKVKGTKALGNFPRKAIRAITANFVDPPELDMQIGDRVWKLQTEDEVRDLLRYHYLACAGGLIYGGENMHWELLPQGEIFLTLPPERQVWYLSRIWFHDFNWLYDYYRAYEGSSYSLKKQALTLLLSYPFEEDIPITRFCYDFAALQPSGDPAQMSEKDLDGQKFFLDSVVLRPLGTFGIIIRNETQTSDDYFPLLKGIRIPKLGRLIFEANKAHFRIS